VLITYIVRTVPWILGAVGAQFATHSLIDALTRSELAFRTKTTSKGSGQTAMMTGVDSSARCPPSEPSSALEGAHPASQCQVRTLESLLKKSDIADPYVNIKTRWLNRRCATAELKSERTPDSGRSCHSVLRASPASYPEGGVDS
jgi:hypothetical protein